jgi:hypothetical protein
MANILKNPTLSGFKTVTYFTDNDGNTGAIEYPDDWEFVYMALHPEDPNRIAQSLHRSKGFAISAGWRKWEAGYVQHGVQLKAGQRYLAKAAFFPDVNFAPGAEADLHAVEWRFWIEGEGDKVWQEWHSTGKGSYKQQEETLFVFEAARDITVDYYFKARSRFPGNVCDLNVQSLTLETVGADYGGANVPRIGKTAAPISDTKEVDVILPPAQGAGGEMPVGRIQDLSGDSFSDALTANDIDVIVKGLREMKSLTTNATVLAAFQRLADVLERMK